MNLTEQQLSTILKVCSKVVKKFQIPGYEQSDLEQEAFLLAVDALSRYDDSLPLENFLSVHVRRRLLNFLRDNFTRKRSVLETEKIDYVKDEYLSKEDTMLSWIENDEIFKKIDGSLPKEYREDYLRFINGASLPTKSRRRLFKKLEEICLTKLDDYQQKS